VRGFLLHSSGECTPSGVTVAIVVGILLLQPLALTCTCGALTAATSPNWITTDNLFQCLEQRAEADPRRYPVGISEIRSTPNTTTIATTTSSRRRPSCASHSYRRRSRATRTKRTEIDEFTATGSTQAHKQHEASIQLLLRRCPAYTGTI
jgi:hypothetical protein